jgi:dCTP deaminase|tara:strand:- start:471 stop:1049 length:579 start_codon:yes stop_codon:yes gene_type:complete
MTVLSDVDIIKSIEQKKLIVDPFDKSAVGPCSIDLSLGTAFRVFRKSEHTHIDPKKGIPDNIMELTEKSDEPFIIHPGEFVLASISEKVRIPDNMIGRLEGRSSWGRLGIVVHSTAGKVDPGFSGHLTLEIANLSNLPVCLHPGAKIAQMMFEMLSSEAENPYHKKKDAKYMHESDPSVSKIGDEIQEFLEK